MPGWPNRKKSSRQSRPGRPIRTIDAHAGGGTVRLAIDGFPSPRGRTMLDKRDWLAREADRWRRMLLLEPRGHADLCGAILTEPTSPGSHAGILFLHNAGYATMSGHGVIAVTTIALERGLIMPGGGDGAALIFDTPAGVIRARGHQAGGAGRVERVTFVNVPSFVVYAGLPVTLGNRRFRADVAYGGAFYAIVDSEAVGLPIDIAHLPELRRAGMAIARTIDEGQKIVHPLDPDLHGIEGTIFTAPPTDERAALKNVAIFADGQAERSPGGTATAAVMAVVDAMGLLEDGAPFVHESVVGTYFTGRIAARTTVGDQPAIVPEIEGVAWITGEHTFVSNQNDPLDEGFRV